MTDKCTGAFVYQHQLLKINLYVQPNSSKDAIVGIHDNKLKVVITAQATDGKANKHLVQFLSKQPQVPKSHIEIVKGKASRHKVVQVDRLSELPVALFHWLS